MLLKWVPLGVMHTWVRIVIIHQFLTVAIGVCLDYRICGTSSSSRFCSHSKEIYHDFLTCKFFSLWLWLHQHLLLIFTKCSSISIASRVLRPGLGHRNRFLYFFGYGETSLLRIWPHVFYYRLPLFLECQYFKFL